MVLRYRDTNGHYKIISVEYVEVEGIDNSETHNGIWIFKEEQKNDTL